MWLGVGEPSVRRWPERCWEVRVVSRDELVRDEEREDVEPLREEEERGELEREEFEREEEGAERPVVECERVPRRVDSSDVTARLPRSSLSDRTRQAEIQLRQSRQSRLFRQLLRLQQLSLPEYSQ